MNVTMAYVKFVVEKVTKYIIFWVGRETPIDDTMLKMASLYALGVMRRQIITIGPDSNGGVPKREVTPILLPKRTGMLPRSILSLQIAQ